MVPNSLAYTGLDTLGHASYGFALSIGARVRGVLTRFYVVQTAGALDGFQYALYATAYACPAGADPTLPADAGLYNVVPALTVPATKADFQGQLAWPEDGINHLWQPYSTGADRRAAADFARQNLYLWIQPASPAAGKVFAAALTLDDAVYT